MIHNKIFHYNSSYNRIKCVVNVGRMGLIGRSPTQIIMGDATCFNPRSRKLLPPTPTSKGDLVNTSLESKVCS